MASVESALKTKLELYLTRSSEQLKIRVANYFIL